jgi:transcriptional regulator with XRE-family HTH domain
MSNAPAEGNIPQFDLADRLRKALRVADVPVQEIADYLGVSRNTVGAWINGRVVPGKAFIRLWAMRTGVPFDWLEKGESPDQGGPGPGARVPQSRRSRSVLPRLDSNQEPAGYPTRDTLTVPHAA